MSRNVLITSRIGIFRQASIKRKDPIFFFFFFSNNRRACINATTSTATTSRLDGFIALIQATCGRPFTHIQWMSGSGSSRSRCRYVLVFCRLLLLLLVVGGTEKTIESRHFCFYVVHRCLPVVGKNPQNKCVEIFVIVALVLV